MIWERLRCESCGRQFDSEDPNAYVCGKCEKIHAEAIERTNSMPSPEFEWPWSKAAMRERLGVSGDVDE